MFMAIVYVPALSAQPYRPFPDSNAVWTVGVYDVFGTFHSRHTYRIADSNVDTVIQTFSYKKIFFFTAAGVPYYKGAIRQTTDRKVFFVQQDSINEQLLYDFAADIGDTVKNVYSDWNVTEPVHDEVIEDVDSILLNDGYHRRLHLPLGFYWIEGIGSTGGLFESTYGGTFSIVYKLDCFMTDNITSFPNGGANCLVLSADEEQDPETGVIIYPNPCAGEINIRLNLSITEELSFKLYNSVGECVYQTSFSGNSCSLFIDQKKLPSGIYFYELTSKYAIKTGQLVVL